ncbi:N-acetylglucosamine-binding protein GbpA [Microbulbifer epialgicus]|uniref:GlcNAc-binding protein A n=1 Tax=Microbulbifer epialgicus TaxID=393907 RepID=A0ABV4NZU5_9GAMM
MILRQKKAASAIKFSAVNSALIAVFLAGTSSNVLSHGYVEEYGGGVASARGTLCKYPLSTTGQKNVSCGAVQWEPQSVEGPEGFPQSGPADGQIASAGSNAWSPLNEQTADRWIKNPITAGKQTFKWHFTANHLARDWKYYITKPNWNPNRPLTRESFDLNPFCVIDGNNQKPPIDMHHECVVPEREGYQVILAVWDVADTAAAFYNVIDVEFGGDGIPVSDWSQGGTINPTQNLKVGDKVSTRVYSSSSEEPTYSTTLEISTDEQGMANNWAYELATKINQEQTRIRAGQFDGENGFNPVYGSNPIYLQDGSGLERVEINYEINSPAPDYDLSVSGLENMYSITSEPLSLQLALTAKGDIRAELKVLNHARETLANYAVNMSDGQSLERTLTLSKSEPGHHMLVVIIKDLDGNLIGQNTQDFHLMEDQTSPPPAGDYDHVFPDGLKSYSAGTKVKGSDGNIYQCKPFPYSGYCVQWSQSATQFEPGTGSDWQLAWDRLSY